ncbi:MAG: glycosyltransferase, partial [Thaumarchaeota archaeon]|nr:glycosyltransferase [Nitrososphaerota archaeon]
MLESQLNKTPETEMWVKELKKWKMNMDKINYDVLIPARNEELIIEKTLHHLSKQSIKPNLVIVVNDNSNDRTKEIAVSYGAKVIDFPYEHKNWVISGKLGIVFSFGMKYF